VLAFSCWSGDCQPKLTFFFFLVIKTLFSFCFAALTFVPVVSEAASSRQCGTSSWYGHGDGFNGQRTANGERFNAYGLTAAHRYLPLGSRIRVVNPANGKAVTVRINDRGPYYGSRILDLSYGAFAKIASVGSGTAQVCIARA
jgi:rare lipoprotein A